MIESLDFILGKSILGLDELLFLLMSDLSEIFPPLSLSLSLALSLFFSFLYKLLYNMKEITSLFRSND